MCESSISYKQILVENAEAVAHFLSRLVVHQGTIQPEKLYVVDVTSGTPQVRKGKSAEKRSDYALGTGGEVPNSFSPLYEVGYFFQCLFLAGVGTAFLRRFLPFYQSLNEHDVFSTVKADLLKISEENIRDGLRKPDIAIVANLDTDVVPLRYYKHQLWRLDPAVLTRRVTEITSEQYGKFPSPALDHNYWTLADQQIAETAMQAADTLVQAKAIQYYLTLQTFAKALAIDIQNIPLYFNFIPKEEMIDGGLRNSFLELLLELHTPEGRIAYRKITGLKNPWLLTKSCPHCGQGDKRILCSKLMGDGRTITVHCKPQAFFFRNEQGNGVTRTGCDHRFSFQVPTSPDMLYEFFQRENFSLHFATRELTNILKDSGCTPVGIMATDLGVTTTGDGNLHKDLEQVKGYGDHLEMLTSALGLQHFVIREKIARSVAIRLKRQRMLLPAPVLLFGYRQRTALFDPEVMTEVNGGSALPVFDTSALKAVERGYTIGEMFQRAVRLHAFSLKELYSLRGKSLDALEQRLQ